MSGPRRPSAPATEPGSPADARLFAPAAERNLEAVGAALEPHLSGRSGTLLEIGSGTGQHAADWAARFPGLAVRPSDPDPAHRASIAAWAQAADGPAPLPPLDLDVTEPWPDLGPLAAVVSLNVIHIAPWAVAEALVAGAARRLGPGGVLILYGPFREGGAHTAESNARFDASLRARDPDWGVRDLDEVAALAAAAGFGPAEVTRMPANNLLVAFAR